MSFATNLHHQASDDRTIPVLLQPEYSGSVLGPDASNKQPAVNNAARCERVTMSSDAASPASEQVGPLERKYLKHANYRAVTDGVKVSRTHWHIATANALGWGFDGMDGVIFALVSPMVIKEFSLTVPQYRSGLQIALLVGIAGLYFWPWLSDRLGRRTLLAVNIALFSLLMPVVALSPTFATFVVARSLVGFALNGEWSLGSMLVAETWPARLRGRVISMTRSTWCLGASLAGGITGLVAASFGWRVAVMVPGVIALLAIYVRATCPESPYWVRAQDRKRRISETLAGGGGISDDDRAWFGKANSVGIRHRTSCPPRWWLCSLHAAAPAFSARSAPGCHCIWRPRNTGRRRNTACSTCSGVFPVSSASAWQAGSPTRSAAGWRSW